MIVTIHQPNFLPWLGFFHKMSLCDTFVILDNVQFVKNQFQNRTRIKTANGILWLTVPVLTKGRFGQDIADVEINPAEMWQKKHLKSLVQSYGKAPYFSYLIDILRDIYEKKWERLIDINITAIEHLAKSLGLKPRFIKASQMPVKGKSSDLILSICKELGTDCYVSGPTGRKYLDETMFQNAGISIRYHEFVHPTYSQCYGPFAPFLSIVDLLANHGPDSASLLLQTVYPDE